MRPRFPFLIFPVFAAFLFVACQGEGEGQPCDTNAGNGGNDDCQPPLVCTTGLTNANSPRCCPQDRANATTSECALSSSTSGDMNPTPPDSSTNDTSSPETSTSEASPPDGPIEGATEAGAGSETGTSGDGAASDGAASDGGAADAAGD